MLNTIFTEEFYNIIQKSVERTSDRKHSQTEPEHILRDLLDDTDVILPFLEELKVDVEVYKRELDERLESLPQNSERTEPGKVRLSETLGQFVAQASQKYNSKRRQSDAIDFLSYMKKQDPKTSLTSKIITNMGITEDNIKQYATKNGPVTTGPLLSQFTTHLNQKVKKGEIDPVIGREKELLRAQEIMLRRTKNNPVFVGEAGVGKSAIAYGLAQAIVDKQVPQNLRDAHIFELDLTSLKAAAQGPAIGGVIQGLIKEIKNFEKEYGPAYIFIDELHSIMTGQGTVFDMSDALKPALAKGEFKCIGATTLDEYHKYIEKDPAMERRFMDVLVEEPSVENTLEILHGLKARYEEKHNVAYTDEALKKAAEFASEYISYRNLPDSAIDLLDEAGAAANFRDPSLRSDREVTVLDICDKVASETGLDAALLTNGVSEQLKSLRANLKNTVFDQDEAIDQIVNVVEGYYAGVDDHDGEKPVGSFILAGPSGVGKTKVSKELADALGRKLIKVDMSEFKAEHEVSRLTGAPPSYVGHGNRIKFLDDVKRHPNAVVLLDEIEKAHPTLFDIFLHVLDEGKLTDGEGKTYDFSNVIFIMTTNLGSKVAQTISLASHDDASGPAKWNGMGAIEKKFRPEFLGRVDKIIPFDYLKPETMPKIARQSLDNINKNLLKKRGLSLEVDQATIDYLAKEGAKNTATGARAVEKTVKEAIRIIATKNLPPGVKNGVVTVTFNEASRTDDKANKFKVKFSSHFNKAAQSDRQVEISPSLDLG